jgi:hypothetical protein
LALHPRLRQAKAISNTLQFGNEFGDEREVESGLTFNQLICEFESRRPRQEYCRWFDLPISDCLGYSPGLLVARFLSTRFKAQNSKTSWQSEIVNLCGS